MIDTVTGGNVTDKTRFNLDVKNGIVAEAEHCSIEPLWQLQLRPMKRG